jgi:hypothetical protein
MNWSATYRARTPLPRDTMDTTDKTPAGNGVEGGFVNSVRCVTGKTKPINGAGIDLGELPAVPCEGCGGGTFWRVSDMEPGGTGPWRCRRCVRPEPSARLDGHALPAGSKKGPRTGGNRSP